MVCHDCTHSPWTAEASRNVHTLGAGSQTVVVVHGMAVVWINKSHVKGALSQLFLLFLGQFCAKIHYLLPLLIHKILELN